MSGRHLAGGLLWSHRLITGTPRTALEKIQSMLEQTTAHYLLCMFSFGDLAPAHAMRSR